MDVSNCKTKPFEHQRKELQDHGGDAFRGLFWEQGTGKTKPIIDSVSELYRGGEVRGLFVLAPNGVHRNWVSDEIPTHMPDDILDQTKCHIWYSSGTVTHQRSFDEVYSHKGLAVLVMSYNALLTDAGMVAWKRFLKSRRCMYVLDESQRIKNPNAKWSRRIVGSKAAAPYKRCLTGTPCANSPFDVYNQLKWLNPDVWTKIGIGGFAMFKQYFGAWEHWSVGSDGRTYPKCVAYRNLPILKEIMEQVGSRVTKEDVLDLPPKLYTKRYFTMSHKQQDMYSALKQQLIVETQTGMVTAPLAITRMLRFQQIVCGYFPKDDDDLTLEDIPGGNPRLEMLADICNEISHQVIVWARFKRDIELISKHPVFRERCVVVDGSVTGEGRGAALDMFKRGDKQFLIANVSTDGVRSGQTLHMAKTVIYYSNSFSLEHRLQSEDRAHRIGQTDNVLYIDIAAEGTIDTHVIAALRKKLDVSCQVTGDNIVEWI